jgi:predicted nucleic acid-binding protein
VIVLDTTILSYAIGAEHPLRASCRHLIELIRDGKVGARTTIEVIQEFVHVRARRRGRAEAVARGREYVRLLQPLVPTHADDLVEGLEVFEGTPSVKAFDAVLAAAARRRGWALASADQGFAAVPGLVWLDPGSTSFIEAVVAAR